MVVSTPPMTTTLLLCSCVMLLLSSTNPESSSLFAEAFVVTPQQSGAASFTAAPSQRYTSTSRSNASQRQAPTTAPRRSRSSQLQVAPVLPDIDTLTLALNSWTTQTHASLLDSAQHTLHSYETLLKESPVTTKAVTSGILAVMGDAIAQFSSAQQRQDDNENDESVESSSPFLFDYNVKRGLGFLAFGALYTGAYQHFWFEYLSAHIASWGQTLHIWAPNPTIDVDQLYNSPEWWTYFDYKKQLEEPPSDAALALAKLAVNQFGMVPALYMPLFFALTGALADLNPKESLERAKSMYFPLLQRNYFYWLPVQFFQFFALPAEWQIPFLSMASLFWTVILSSISSSQTTPSATYVSYSEQNEDEEVTTKTKKASSVIVTPVVNKDVTDDVRLQDVEEKLVPGVVKSTLKNPKVRGTTTGGLVGLLVAAAEDGWIAGFLAPFVGGASGAVGFLTAVGATLGLLATANKATSASAKNGDDNDEFVSKDKMDAIDTAAVEVKLSVIEETKDANTEPHQNVSSFQMKMPTKKELVNH